MAEQASVSSGAERVLGYDPGGNGAHGLAELCIREGAVEELRTSTLATAEDVLARLDGEERIVALGVDT